MDQKNRLPFKCFRGSLGWLAESGRSDRRFPSVAAYADEKALRSDSSGHGDLGAADDSERDE